MFLQRNVPSPQLYVITPVLIVFCLNHNKQIIIKNDRTLHKDKKCVYTRRPLVVYLENWVVKPLDIFSWKGRLIHWSNTLWSYICKNKIINTIHWEIHVFLQFKIIYFELFFFNILYSHSTIINVSHSA